ncbi:MAG: MBOAT family protein [Hungatella sp.]|nr:MBOAT family protein [Hungatella sp.]MCI9128344.1 MBOAT family protein [Eubacterium sp.]
MLFNSLRYLVFFPIVICIYFIIPDRIKYIWLLLSSYYFYMCWNAKYAFLILFSTIVTWFCGLLLEYISKKKVLYKKVIVASSLILNLSILAYFKYTNFLLQNLERFFGVSLAAAEVDILLPVGISFFTFQALGYTIDVYRGEIAAEKNILRYALFVSFFPQLVAGPIERSKNLLTQLKVPTHFNVKYLREGLLTIAYGLFIKIVIADSISQVVDPVFSDPMSYGGMELLTVTILFAFQIYCDFDGYTRIAIGSARILGYHLNPNFDSPYMAISVKDFWKRWHISLTSWFRDYLYLPLGGNRKGKWRKQVNTMIVFLCSGLWHGAAWHYVIWGGINGMLSCAEDICKTRWTGFKTKYHIDDSRKLYSLLCGIVTFIVIDITWLFFRAKSVRHALYIITAIARDFRFEWFLTGAYSDLFSSVGLMIIIMVSLVLMGIVDYLNRKGRRLNDIILSQQICIRWLIYWAIFIIILYWGIYGNDFRQTQFIYFQF